MDPYLEGRPWKSFHSQFIAEIARQLNPLLKPNYVALLEDSAVLEPVELSDDERVRLIPDVSIVHEAATAIYDAQPISGPPLRLETTYSERIDYHFIEVRTTPNLELVTVIELLSPGNKVGVGYDEYFKKRSRILATTANLVELDLLRVGQRVPMRTSLPSAPYFAFVHRSATRPMADIWPIFLTECLPTIPIPLRRRDPDVPLNLQAILSEVYDLVGYERLIDFRKRPEPPLSDEELAWIDDTLRSAGFRKDG
jgi:hypothetical protein